MLFFAVIVGLSVLTCSSGIGIEYERVLHLEEGNTVTSNHLEEYRTPENRDLHNLVVQRTAELELLLRKQEQSLSALAAGIATSVTSELVKLQDKSAAANIALCGVQEALIYLLQASGAKAEDVISKLQSSMTCNEKNNSEHEDDCHPTLVEPEETVGIYSMNTTSQGVCSNPYPVPGINKCNGRCSSMTGFGSQDGEETFTSRCTCCKPSRVEKVRVDLTCENGVSFSRNYDNIAACQCLDCQEAV